MKLSIEERLEALEHENQTLKDQLAKQPQRKESDGFVCRMGKADANGVKSGKGFKIRIFKRDAQGKKILLAGSTPQKPKYELEPQYIIVWNDAFEAMMAGKRKSAKCFFDEDTPQTSQDQ